MKKLYSLVLMAAALLVGANAWATTHTVGTYADLQTALTNAVNGDVIEFTADITYDGAWRTVTTDDLNSATTVEAALCITKSLTLDGKGHKLIGWGKHDIAIGATNGVLNCYSPATLASKAKPTKKNVNTIHRVTLAIHPDSEAAIDVVIKNLSIAGNQIMAKRYYGLIAFDGVHKLSMDNVSIETKDGYYSQQALCATGSQATPIVFDIKNSMFSTGMTGYTTYFLKPITGTISNSVINGWCGLYFKNRNIPVYGAVVGTRGSNLTCDAVQFTCPNVHNGESNDFAVIPIEDDGITLNLKDCSINSERLGTQSQSIVCLQAPTRTSGYQPVTINISGDNTHIFNVNHNPSNPDYSAIWNYFASANTGAYYDVITGDKGGNGASMDIALNVNITGGTFTADPRTFAYPVYGGNMTTPTIPQGEYEVKEITTQQGDETTTIWRVREVIVTPTSTNINDDIQGEGDGQNDDTNFKIASNQTVQETSVVANYIEVSNDATLTVPAGKELVVTNGLDVTDGATVDVKAGSTLVVGDGGVTTESVSSIVIEANENGAASFLISPEVIVNTTPNLTVKMKAKNIGWIMNGSNKEYYWHRFALPIQTANSWVKNPNKSTYVFGWNYSANSWEQLSALTQMVPFKGYTLSADYEATDVENLHDIEYTFTGQLAGNQNSMLEFERNGFNFFGNSYTGYISILALVEQIMGDNKIDGTVWMWGEGQQYYAVPLQQLRDDPDGFDDWQKEVAPMQTFIMKQNGSVNASTELDYASAIWGNPRYNNTALAPQRIQNNETTRMRIIVTADNGKSDFVMFSEEDRFSDAFEKGYDGEKYMNENALNMYARVNDVDYSAVATDNLAGKALTLNTVESVNYTMSFAKVSGETYAIRDLMTNIVTPMTEGNTYTFAAQPNTTIEGRFVIVPMQNMPTDIETVENNATVKGIYTIMGQYVGEDYDALPAGMYIVNGVKIVK